MIDVTLQELDKRLAQIGRGVVLISVSEDYTPTPGVPLTVADTQVWDTAGPLHLAHIGNNEEDIEPSIEVAESELTFPEYTGPLAHDRYYDGEAVTLTIPLHFANPALMAITSPTGVSAGGHGRQRKVREHTVVVVPEQLLALPNSAGFGALTYSGTWEVGGVALNAEQVRLLGLSLWVWRGSWGRTLPGYRHANGGKSIEPVEFKAMYHPDLPDGHRAFTFGDPNTYGIDLLGAQS